MKRLDNIPQELKDLPQWVCYKAIPKEGHWGKKIISPVNGELARANAPETWTSFEKAVEYMNRRKMDGLTFALTDGIVFVDFDEVDEKPQEVKDRLGKLCDELEGTYCETSVSGKGIHYLCKGRLPERSRKKNEEYGLEMYDKLRFVCISGNVIGEPVGLADFSDRIARLNREYIGKPYTTMKIAPRTATETDREIIDAIRNSRQGVKFDRLYSGDWSGYSSQSSADFALIKILTFWTQDAGQIDSIFRTSGLYRPKWDKCNGYYGRYQISQALRLTTNVRKKAAEM